MIYNVSADIDYQSVSASTVTLTSLDPEQCIAVTVIDDLIFEEIESLTVTLFYIGQLNSDKVNIFPDTALIFINDDDGETSNTYVHVDYVMRHCPTLSLFIPLHSLSC